MKSAFTFWANLEAARDDSSMNLNYEVHSTVIVVSVTDVQVESRDRQLLLRADTPQHLHLS